MESPTWPETSQNNRINAIQELTQGQEVTNNLRDLLRWSQEFEGEPTSADGVVVQILKMFDNTLLILGSSTSNRHVQLPTSHLCFDEQESVKTIPLLKHKRRCYKKRKQSWTSSHVTSTLVDDGHAWRKYGQKHINNAKHERSYYRCTYKYDQGCLATKQVQQINDQPAKYKTTYSGNHNCRNLQRAPEIILDSPDRRDTSILLNFETNELIANTQVVPYSPSTKQELKVAVPSETNLYSSSENYLARDPMAFVSHVPLEPVSMMLSTMDNWDMITSATMVSTHGCEMDHILEMDCLNDFPFELCV